MASIISIPSHSQIFLTDAKKYLLPVSIFNFDNSVETANAAKCEKSWIFVVIVFTTDRHLNNDITNVLLPPLTFCFETIIELSFKVFILRFNVLKHKSITLLVRFIPTRVLILPIFFSIQCSLFKRGIVVGAYKKSNAQSYVSIENFICWHGHME